jgi:GNAT superfamily N-acetyltransferase
VIFAADGSRDGERIAAFRYFMMSPTDPRCRMFATFVEPSHRRTGIAKRLILESFERAISNGYKHFEVRMSLPETPEKDGLFRWYSLYADASCPPFKFEIYYTGKKYKRCG